MRSRQKTATGCSFTYIADATFIFPGEAGATEAITMAGLEHFKVISVDYRMPPEAYRRRADGLQGRAATTNPNNWRSLAPRPAER